MIWVYYCDVRSFEKSIELWHKVFEICRLYLKYAVLGNKVGKVIAYLYFLVEQGRGKVAFKCCVYLLFVQNPDSVAAVCCSGAGTETRVVGQSV